MKDGYWERETGDKRSKKMRRNCVEALQLYFSLLNLQVLNSLAVRHTHTHTHTCTHSCAQKLTIQILLFFYFNVGVAAAIHIATATNLSLYVCVRENLVAILDKLERILTGHMGQNNVCRWTISKYYGLGTSKKK